MEKKTGKFRTDFLGYPVDNISMEELMDFADAAIIEGSFHFIGVQNANKMFLMDKFIEVKNAIEMASIILPENAINMGMRFLRKPLKERNMGGVHSMEKFLILADLKGYCVYFLGTTDEVLDKLVKRVGVLFPDVKVVGWRNGFFKSDDELEVLSEIRSVRPNFLFVGLGSPKQEIFISKYLNKLNSNVCLGVGGSLNVIAGDEKPAPGWTKYGLEWLYRSFQDPKKFKRYFIINSYFVWKFIKYFVCFNDGKKYQSDTAIM